MTARHTSRPPRGDIYSATTAKIIAAIEAGTATYTFPWHQVAGPPRNFISGRAYRGINTVLLWLTGHAQGYATPYWATFRQWAERGCFVRAGEKATTVIFWKQRRADTTGREDGDHTQDRDGSGYPAVARAYSVFNASQVQGFNAPELPILPDDARNAAAEAFFAALPLTVHHDADMAFYRPRTDTIHLPPFRRFVDANGYYATRAHESVHATGAPHRLDRNLSIRFGSEAYAMEELIAELGAAFLCADLRLSPEPRPDHAAYISSWLRVLKRDSRAVFMAAGRAQAAVDWLHGHDAAGDDGAPALADAEDAIGRAPPQLALGERSVHQGALRNDGAP